MHPPPVHLLEEASREFLLACDREGILTWVDGRARRLIPDVRPGQHLLALAPPGLEQKADMLLQLARGGRVDGWELPLVIDGRALTVSFSARRHDEGMVLLGQLEPEPLALALVQAQQSMAEVVALHRQVHAQKRELEQRHAELVRLNRELEESNRGVLTLHAELEDRVEQLQRTSLVKTRMVSNVSHELRTPLHSILGLTQLLMTPAAGTLQPEQRKQVQFIRSAAEELLQLVDDVLDLTRSEAGKAPLHLERFELGELLSALRGALRPLLPADSPVALIFDMPESPVWLETDRTKVSQILRNLVSNALKFTEQGEVRVGATLNGEELALWVRDTGLGIAPENHERIFEEFGQVDSALQRRVRGSGLGLPLSRRLAALLGGTLRIQSALGQGSTFTLRFPLEHPQSREIHALQERSRGIPPGPSSVLVVEDDLRSLLVHEKYLSLAGIHVIPARTVEEARRALRTARPAAIVLDILLEGETSWGLLAELKRDPGTRDIPVLVVTVTDESRKARALGANEFWLKPFDHEQLLNRLRALTERTCTQVLIIDDDERFRYLLRKHLEGGPFQVLEAATGSEGVALALREQPQLILLDFLLGEGLTAFHVLPELKADPRTRCIPIIIVTSSTLGVQEQARLLEDADSLLSKQGLSRESLVHRIQETLRRARWGRHAEVETCRMEP